MLTRRHFLTASAALPLTGLIATPALAAKPPVFATDGVAINGIDPVAYFLQGKPVEGTTEFVSDWNGAEVRFSSLQHKIMFDTDTERFAPKYGGYCAYAVSKGATAPTDPEAWTVYRGRLYLNFSLDVRDVWQKDIPGNLKKADANWPGVLDG
ncbi:MAG: twin-arginine translocation signal domain-containing protein [Silicimonas sp.]|nr:twin-arginine translocation signal domain-containing protein [Silicimonas sp.]